MWQKCLCVTFGKSNKINLKGTIKMNNEKKVEQEAFTVSETATIMNVTRRTILAMLSDGRLKGFKVGAHWRIHRKEIDRYMNNE